METHELSTKVSLQFSLVPGHFVSGLSPLVLYLGKSLKNHKGDWPFLPQGGFITSCVCRVLQQCVLECCTFSICTLLVHPSTSFNAEFQQWPVTKAGEGEIDLNAQSIQDEIVDKVAII